MSATFTTNIEVQVPGKSIRGTGVQVAGAVAFIDDNIAAASNQEFDIDFKYGQLKSVVIYSPVACTVKTNSSGSPDNTITIVAGEVFQWRDGDAFANPFTADVTKIFITSAAASTFQMYALHDPTV